MSPTRKRPGSPSAFLAETQLLPRKELHPNSWNYNRMNAFQYARLLESITEFGFIDPILARPCANHMDYEIVGGENRWNAAGELGVPIVPVIVRQMTDPVARKISIIDNELHGQGDPTALGDLLQGLKEELGAEELLRALPYDEDILSGFLNVGTLSDVEPPGEQGHSPEAPSAKEKWVERTYRMPESIAEVIDDAITKARKQLSESSKDFEALEIIAAEYLAS